MSSWYFVSAVADGSAGYPGVSGRTADWESSESVGDPQGGLHCRGCGDIPSGVSLVSCDSVLHHVTSVL